MKVIIEANNLQKHARKHQGTKTKIIGELPVNLELTIKTAVLQM